MTIEERGLFRSRTCDVSIVNTGDEENLSRCKTALVESTVPVNILVADNTNNKMGGFARAHNANVKRGASPYVLILNPDVFVEPNCIATAMECRRMNRADIVGANFGTPLWGFPTWSGAVRSYGMTPDCDCQWPHVMGAFMLMLRSTWERLAGFDERFSPLYYEDLDLCARAKTVWFCANAHATHIGCATTDRMKWRRRYWHTKNRIKFVLKWRGKCAF